jgi:hypothetical protein
MKQLLLVLLMCIGGMAFAHGPGGYRPNYHQYHHHNRADWIVPALIGGAVVYAATRPVVVQQPPVAVTSPPSDIVYIDGVAYRRQLMLVNGAYQEVLIRI